MLLKVGRYPDTYLSFKEDVPIKKMVFSDANEGPEIGPSLITQKLLDRSRRSPCGGDLINACRGRSLNGNQIVENLIQSHPNFFNSSGT